MRHFQAVLRLDTRNPPGNEHLAAEYLKSVSTTSAGREINADRSRLVDFATPRTIGRVKGRL